MPKSSQSIKKMNIKLYNIWSIRYNGPANTIFIMDRGYECYNSIAHIEQKGMYYIIRAKDPSSHGIAASVKNQLPDEDTFDVNTSFYISKKKTTDVKKASGII